MQTQLEPRKKSHRILVLILVILLTAGPIGGGVYYVMSNNAKKEKEANDKLIAELQKKSEESKQKTDEEKKTETATSKEEITSNIFDLLTAKVGDKVGTMTISSINPFSMTINPPRNEKLSSSNANIVFSGQVVIDGDYSYAYDAFSGSYDLVFNVSKASYNNLPVIKGSEDNKSPMWFSNKTEAIKLLGITENTEKKGTAKITIKDYVINRFPSEVRDTIAIVGIN